MFLIVRTTSYTVTLPPDVECRGCAIRLLREANEWSGSYEFWSCADVDIVRGKLYNEKKFMTNDILIYKVA